MLAVVDTLEDTKFGFIRDVEFWLAVVGGGEFEKVEKLVIIVVVVFEFKVIGE